MKVFHEIQRFNQWWLRLIVIASIIICAVSLMNVFKLIKEEPLGFWITFTISSATILFLLALLFFVKLETKIDEHGIHYQFWPFNSKQKTFKWSDIQTCNVRTYNPITEYGGWGYRTGFFKKNGALNVKGNKGIQIKLNNGRQLLIGTQKENEANRVIETYSHKISPSKEN